MALDGARISRFHSSGERTMNGTWTNEIKKKNFTNRKSVHERKTQIHVLSFVQVERFCRISLLSFIRSCFVHLVNNFDSKRRFLSWRFYLRITSGNTKLWYINNNSQIVWISYTSRGSNKIEGGSRSKDERNMNERWTKLLEVRSRTLFSKLISTVSSFMNMFVHVLFMFRSFVNDFYRFRFYRSSSHERTK